MQLTAAQLAIIKADIIAASDPECVALEADPTNSDKAFAVAELYNLKFTPDYFVWRDIPMDTVLGLITNASMTPVDAVPAVTSLPSNPTAAQQATYNNQIAGMWTWVARSLSCQGKQFNLQNLIISRTTAPMKQTSYRASMQDCLTAIPAGANGQAITANWVGVRDAAKFTASRIEKILATGAGTFVAPSDLGAEGTITSADVLKAME